MASERDVNVRLRVIPEGAEKLRAALGPVSTELERQQAAAGKVADELARAGVVAVRAPAAVPVPPPPAAGAPPASVAAAPPQPPRREEPPPASAPVPRPRPPQGPPPPAQPAAAPPPRAPGAAAGAPAVPSQVAGDTAAALAAVSRALVHLQHAAEQARPALVALARALASIHGGAGGALLGRPAVARAAAAVAPPDQQRGTMERFWAGLTSRLNPRGPGGQGDMAGGIGAALAGGGGLPGLLGALGPIGKAAGAASVALSAVTGAIGGVVQAVVGLFESVLKIVEIGAPAVFKEFQDAYRDAMAVIGQALAPLVKHWADLLRIFGDFLASVLPSQQEMQAIFDEMKPAMDALREVLQEIAPYVKDVVVGALRLFAEHLKIVAKAVEQVMDVLRAITPSWGAAPLASARGRGDHSPASFVNVEEIGARARQASFSVAAAAEATTTPQWQTDVSTIAAAVGIIKKAFEIGKSAAGASAGSVGMDIGKAIGSWLRGS